MDGWMGVSQNDFVFTKCVLTLSADLRSGWRDVNKEMH